MDEELNTKVWGIESANPCVRCGGKPRAKPPRFGLLEGFHLRCDGCGQEIEGNQLNLVAKWNGANPPKKNTNATASAVGEHSVVVHKDQGKAIAPEKTEDRDMALLRSHAAQLSEHFDAVQIFCTRNDPYGAGGTINCQYGNGNWFARYGHVTAWLAAENNDMKLHNQPGPEEM